MTRIHEKILRLVCLVLFASLAANAAAASVNITIRMKNTDSVAHSFCLKIDGGEGEHEQLLAGATRSIPKFLDNGQVVAVRWGVDQGNGSSSCTNKDYDAMRDDNGTTTYTVVAA